MKVYALFCLALAIFASTAATGFTSPIPDYGGFGKPRGTALEARTTALQCTPLRISLGSSDPAAFHTSFVAISPPGSYELASDGLELFLDRPRGQIATKGNVNNKVAEGATINSTFTILHGRVTFTFSGPSVAGAVTAAILIADQHDEIDVELVGGDPQHWQTNVFAPAPHDDQPLYGVFGEIEDYPREPKSVDETHSYTIDWNAERVQWSVDGATVRTLRKADTNKNGALHYPVHPARLQLGIWDASSPAGTSEWARGPIDWDTAPRRMSAKFEHVEVECPY
ncbi:concanavalin A-like lectin/glucanase [Cubamyces sp. BRFM 1775]|nr:concanavalin A-like lectin/glucanase [Cubamyces sp. BRFM 1775]